MSPPLTGTPFIILQMVAHALFEGIIHDGFLWFRGLKAMRLLALIGGALLAAILSGPAWAWQDSKPGGEHWPPIPGNAGMGAFYGSWWPQCDDGAWQDRDTIFIEPNGIIRYKRNPGGFPTQYRVIETTPYGVTLAVHTPASKGRDDINRFWILRYLNAKTSHIGVHECFPHTMDIKGFRWDFTDDELKQFWSTFKACNPAVTYKDPRLKDEGFLYWGRGWDQSCDLYRTE